MDRAVKTVLLMKAAAAALFWHCSGVAENTLPQPVDRIRNLSCKRAETRSWTLLTCPNSVSSQLIVFETLILDWSTLPALLFQSKNRTAFQPSAERPTSRQHFINEMASGRQRASNHCMKQFGPMLRSHNIHYQSAPDIHHSRSMNVRQMKFGHVSDHQPRDSMRAQHLRR